MALPRLFACLLLALSSAQGHSTESGYHKRVRRGDLSAGDLVQAAAAEFESRARDAAAASTAQLEERLASLEKRLDEQSTLLEEALSALAKISDNLSGLQPGGARSGPQPSDRPSPTAGRVLGEPCRVNSECSDLIANTECGDGGRCVCAGGLLRGPGETCLPAPWLGGECRTDHHCDVRTPHAMCSPEWTCRCPADMMTIQGKCRPFPRLSEHCLSDADCRQATKYAVCSPLTRRCVCPRGSWNFNNMHCRLGVPSGRPCLYDRDCSTMQKIYTCIGGICQVRRCDPHSGASNRFRLVGGNSCNNGYVEFTYDSGQNWTFLCDSNWTGADATVLCSYMGFDYGHPMTVNSRARATSTSNVTRFLWVEDLECEVFL
ncbi:hypothetical protein FJT64_014226 [Amphibalanus amphitrite]|uniref:SRCR domain-containing protein n=1 Tax=Amphibalanus amphitrite TaxID=1232801 RepID=A0A6A4VCF1_AMPAM|nr:hypothetical protein FJT64_014226 [Amphibalanus amphitrite]